MYATCLYESSIAYLQQLYLPIYLSLHTLRYVAVKFILDPCHLCGWDFNTNRAPAPFLEYDRSSWWTIRSRICFLPPRLSQGTLSLAQSAVGYPTSSPTHTYYRRSILKKGLILAHPAKARAGKSHHSSKPPVREAPPQTIPRRILQQR